MKIVNDIQRFNKAMQAFDNLDIKPYTITIRTIESFIKDREGKQCFDVALYEGHGTTLGNCIWCDIELETMEDVIIAVGEYIMENIKYE